MVIPNGSNSCFQYSGSDETVACTEKFWVLKEWNSTKNRQSIGFISWKSQLCLARISAGFIDLHFCCYVKSVLRAVCFPGRRQALPPQLCEMQQVQSDVHRRRRDVSARWAEQTVLSLSHESCLLCFWLFSCFNWNWSFTCSSVGWVQLSSTNLYNRLILYVM